MASCSRVSDTTNRDETLPFITSYVNDYARILSDSSKQALENSISRFEEEMGSQIVILTTDTLNRMDIREFGVKVANMAGIGRKDYDDGILILVAPNNRQASIEVSYGLEESSKMKWQKPLLTS